MHNNTIVTLADSNYYDMLNELIDSIRNFPQSKNVSICVLDAGLSEDQIKSLEKKVFKIKKQHENDKIQEEDDLEDVL